MSTMPLPERPNLEQLKKQAKNLQRAVRSGDQAAFTLVTQHHPDGAAALSPLEKFPLDSALLVLARRHGFASWPRLREHLATPPAPQSSSRVLTLENRYHARPGWAADEDTARCARAAHSDAAGWRPLLTAHHNDVKVIAFATPDGPLFCELTPTRVTVSQRRPSSRQRAELVFRTAFGTLAGVVAPEVTSLALESPTNRMARTYALVTDGIFLVPNAFRVTSSGLVIRVDHEQDGDLIPMDALPKLAETIVDSPAPRPPQDSPAGQRIAAAIASADAPPVVDPDQWVPGVHTGLTATEELQLGRYRDLLFWTQTGLPPHVFDFGPQQGPLRQYTIEGTTMVATRMYYDFQNGSSGTIALVGLVQDDRTASITLSRAGKPDAEALIEGGTFVLAGPELDGLAEHDLDTTHFIVRDATGEILERVPYPVRERRAGTALPPAFAELWGADRQRQNAAYTELMAATESPVPWTSDAWDEVVANLTHADNHNRAIAAQILCNLAAHDPSERILGDLDALMKVTKDERFVTARHSLKSLWKIGLGTPTQRHTIVKALEVRYGESTSEKNGTLIRNDIVESLRRLHDAVEDPEIEKVARALIEDEPDLKYRRKYAKHWK